MSIRAMFVGNAPARAAAPAPKKETGPLPADPRAEQELAQAILGETPPAAPSAAPPAAPAQTEPPRA